MSRLVIAVLAVLVVTGSARADQVTVRIENFTFSPAELTVKPGTTVVWENADDIPHSVVEKDGKFHSAALDTDQTFSMAISDAGEIDYYCGLHPHMTGKIIVKP
jgi:plastocyanin